MVRRSEDWSPGGSVHGERANFGGLVLGCIDADFCNQILINQCVVRSFSKSFQKEAQASARNYSAPDLLKSASMLQYQVVSIESPITQSWEL